VDVRRRKKRKDTEDDQKNAVKFGLCSWVCVNGADETKGGLFRSDEGGEEFGKISRKFSLRLRSRVKGAGDRPIIGVSRRGMKKTNQALDRRSIWPAIAFSAERNPVAQKKGVTEILEREDAPRRRS